MFVAAMSDRRKQSVDRAVSCPPMDGLVPWRARC